MATILIVDDDKHTRALLERIIHHDPRLKTLGVKIVHAADGEEGLRAVEAERPALVVTDLLMPRMDGFRFCEALRKHPAGKDVGLLVVSGVYRDHAVAQRLREQFRGTLFTKPYQLKELVEAVCIELGAGQEEPSVAALVESAAGIDDADAPPRTGELAERPLSQLILDLHEEKATGILEVRRGKVEKRIDWVVGYPVAVTSNQRSEALGHFLVGRGVITEAQHQTALERASDEELKLGEALQELGFVTSAELVKQLGAQARQKITAALRWPDGRYSFRHDRSLLDGATGTAMDPVAIVLLGLKRTAPIDEASRQVTGLLGRRVRFSPRGERVASGIIRAFGALLVDELRTGSLVDRLLAEPFEPAKAIPALEALHAAGCLMVASDPTEGNDEVIEIEPLDPYALDELSIALHAEPPPTAAPTDATLPAPFEGTGDALLYQAIFGNTEITGVEDLGASSGVPEAVETLDSSVVDVARFGDDPQTSPHVKKLEPVPPRKATGPARAVVPDADPGVAAAREAILAEHLRIRGRDWYHVLGVERKVDAAAVTAAATALEERFRLEKFGGLDLGADYAKLEEILGVYRLARETLASPSAREAYDKRLAVTGAPPTHEAMRAELAFREGEKRLAAGQIVPAVECLQRAVVAAPDVADYHAGLGWALHLVQPRPGETAISRERSARHLAQALAIDADHGAAHEYSGRILAALGEKEESALGHLERALDASPPRLGALPALEELRRKRREVPLLERRCRKLIHSLQSSAVPGDPLRLWLTLGSIYKSELRDADAARTAYQSALRLAPEEPSALAALGDLYAGDPARFAERAELLRTRWRLDPAEPSPGRDLFAGAVAAGRPDLAYVTAAVLAVRGDAGHEPAAAYHRRFRAPFLPRAQQAVGAPLGLAAILDAIRHPDDDAEVGELVAAIAPAAAAAEPLTLADLEVGQLEPVDEAALSPVFRRVRDYFAALLGVPSPRVVACADFAEQIHVAGLTPPVLLAGPGALAATDPVELGFRLGRAASYLLPGRAFGGSRPGRVLRDVVMGVMEAAVGSNGEDPTGRIARVREAAGQLPEEERKRLYGLARHMAEDRRAVNMSRWARGLGRTADRLGLVLCADPAVAGRALSGFVEGEVLEELCDFALSAPHLEARRALGLSVDI